MNRGSISDGRTLSASPGGKRSYKAVRLCILWGIIGDPGRSATTASFNDLAGPAAANDTIEPQSIFPERSSTKHIAEIVHRKGDGLFQIGLIDELGAGPFPSRRFAAAIAARLRPP